MKCIRRSRSRASIFRLFRPSHKITRMPGQGIADGIHRAASSYVCRTICYTCYYRIISMRLSNPSPRVGNLMNPPFRRDYVAMVRQIYYRSRSRYRPIKLQCNIVFLFQRERDYRLNEISSEINSTIATAASDGNIRGFFFHRELFLDMMKFTLYF